ncbi:family 14 glycosylhydrolase [Metabacillus sediminilitoris]|uniref:Beta-amylase n=1 Tax=Metabacillus sediminilitoris TaxID=2567941 RepID=A0A4S4BRI5_9BACI|nr:family 14 glycosylhydrolase [Metabacillus sediminilitoris]QGQ45522.1 family 14 glycosylhydrolase [Metabacillus sediminilitoris]THF77621.1 glycosyl hydrolase family protein [Metabacillus sediminilitoris]
MRKISYTILAFMLCLVALFSSYSPAQAEVKSDYKLYVMAPLGEVTDWDSFKKQLVQLKESGVYALTTDVWWGLVEGNGDNQFDWSYYKKYAEVVESSGLKWVPIMSTHQCGGNVGDDCNYPLPTWIWDEDSVENMAFKSESGYLNKEALAPWWDEATGQYNELYKSFAKNFADKKSLIVKIYLSGGPAGELRYPSYQFADGWDYPERGQLQAYTEGAKKDFRRAIKEKYATLKKLNTAWGTKLKNWNQIQPPNNGDEFFTSGEAYSSQYGKDFMEWYQGALEDHLQKIAKVAHKQFDSTFNVPIGAKISGVHWKMNDPEMPHAAEYSTGYYNYSQLLDQFKKSDLAITFTCLEMGDHDAYNAPYYSAPRKLVTQIANLANERGISLNGENALPLINNEWGFDNSAEVVFNYNFEGFTLLRMTYLFNDEGNPTNEFNMMRDKLGVKSVPVTFTVNNVPSAAGQGVYLTGARGEIGRWNPAEYEYKLTQNSDGNWSGTFNLGADRLYEFKFVLKDANGNITWQHGDNNSYHTPSTGVGEYSSSW